MTIRIEIQVDHHGLLDNEMAALGYVRATRWTSVPEEELPQAAQDAKVYTQPAHDQDFPAGEPFKDLPPEDAPKQTLRVRGQPAPGKTRRTKAEIAEDEAAEKAEQEAAATAAGFAPDKILETEPEGNGNISESPEDRVGPEDVDDAATAQQDAADEAAETATDKTALTHDDIRDVLGKYRTAYGLEAAMEDGPVILQEVCGEGVVKISAVPDDKIAAAIDAVKATGKANRFNRTSLVAA